MYLSDFEMNFQEKKQYSIGECHKFWQNYTGCRFFWFLTKKEHSTFKCFINRYLYLFSQSLTKSPKTNYRMLNRARETVGSTLRYGTLEF